MPAQSKAQQRFMGMVHAVQKGDMEAPSPEVAKVAADMDKKSAKDFASTKHKELPEKIKEIVLAELRSVRAIQTDYAKVIDSMEKHLEAYKNSKGTPAEKQHIQQLKTLTAQKKKLAAELDAKVSGMYKDAELKVDELTGSGAAGPYNTPFAFGKPEDEDKRGKKLADLAGYSAVKESKQYKKGDKLKIKLPNGKKIDVVFDMYARTKGVALGKFKDGSGEYDIKPFNLDTIVETIKESWTVKDGSVLSNGKLIGYYDFDRDSDSFWVDDVKKGKGQLSFDTKKEVEDYFKKNEKDAVKHLQKLRESVNENRWLELKKEDSTAQAKIGRGISNIHKQLKEMERFLNWYGKIKNESGVDNKSYWKRTNSHIYNIKERLLKLDQKIRQISE